MDHFKSVLNGELPIGTAGADQIPLVGVSGLFQAEFTRDGDDLIIQTEDALPIRLIDYFDGTARADLLGDSGGIIRGSTIDIMTRAQAPLDVAQAGAVVSSSPSSDLATAIGQVEDVSGTARVQRADGTTEILELGAKVFANDVVRTDAGSVLSLTFVDGTIFTLSASSRMVLDTLIYDPNSASNSATFDLIEGTFVFIAGQVAKTGEMEVTTPAATMGIRGTTVIVKIDTVDGDAVVEVTLNDDPDGTRGEFEITGLDGGLIGNVDSVETKWIISAGDGQARVELRTPEDIAFDQIQLNSAFSSFGSANQRVDDGGEYVETENPSVRVPDGPDQDGPDQDGPEQETAPPGDSGGAPENFDVDPDAQEFDEGSLKDRSTTVFTYRQPEPEDIATPPVAAAPPLGSPIQFSAPSFTIPEFLQTAFAENGVQPLVNQRPSLDISSINATVVEDSQTPIRGFVINDPENSQLEATLVAGSTITLASTAGITIVEGTGVDDVRLVIRGTASAINNALDGIIYKPSENADATGTLSITVSDGEQSVEATLIVKIAAQQDAPTARNDRATISEDAALFTANLLSNDSDPDVTPTPDVLSVVSVEQGGYPLTFDVSNTLAGGGTLRIAQDGALSFDVGSAYDGLKAGEVYTERLVVTITDDKGNTDQSSLVFRITGSDTRPTVAGENLSLTQSQTLNTNVLTNDSDSEGAALSLVSAAHNGSALTFGTPFTTVGGGSFTINADGSSTFSAGTAYDALGSGQTATETFTYVVTDGTSSPVMGTLTVVITGTNDLPILSRAGPVSATYTENAASTALLSAFTISDIDDTQLAAATIAITAPQAGDVLGFTSSGGITGSYNSITGILILTGASSLANYQTVLNTVTYFSTSDDLSTTPRTLEFTVFDVEGISNTVTATVNPSPVNDAPVFTGTLSSLTATEDVATALDLSALSVSDVDAGSAALALTLTVGSGTLALTASNGVTIVGSVVTGTAAQLNAWLAASAGSGDVSYTSAGDASGAVAFNYALFDLGNTGAGGALSTNGSAIISVSAVNDAPVITGTLAGLTAAEDIASALDLSALSISDVDAGAGTLALTLSVGAGTLALTASNGVTVNGLVVTGTAAQLNAWLAASGGTGDISYTSALNASGGVNLGYSVSDQGNTGSGGALSTGGSASITVSAVNDAPVMSGTPAGFAATAGIAEALDLTTISLSDIDAGASTVSFTIATPPSTVPIGTITFTASDGVSVSNDFGSSTVTGTLAQINAWLSNTVANSSASYEPLGGPGGTVALTFTVDDLGNTGSGGAQNAVGTSLVTVSPSVFSLDVTTLASSGSESLLNGSFETGAALSGVTPLAAGSTAISNWQVSGFGVDYHDGSALAGFDGSRSVDLNGAGGAGALAQSIATVIGETYDLSLQVRTSGANAAALTIATSSGLNETLTLAGGATQYTPVNLTFTATATTTTLTLTGDGSGADGVLVDDVSVRIATGTAQVAQEDIPLELSNIILTQSVAGDLTVTLAANFGTLTVKTGVAGGLSEGDITGNGTYDLVLTGTAAEITTTLDAVDGLIYRGNPNSVQDDQINVGAFQGASGLGRVVNVTVAAVSDAVPANVNLSSVVAGLVPNLQGVHLHGNNDQRIGQGFVEVGDINNDGIMDFAVGSQPTTTQAPGAGYIIYGAEGANPLASFANGSGFANLNSIVAGGGGFELMGASGSRAGFDIAGGTDLNGDGIADLVISAIGVSSNAGRAYVIDGGQDFGALSNAAGEISLASVGGTVAGWTLTGQAGSRLGSSVTSAGDINGDGIADIIFGSSAIADGAWVVFGGQDIPSLTGFPNFDVADISVDGSGTGPAGFKLAGGDNGDHVEIIGDFNGDGIDDFIVSEFGTQSVYVIYGGQDWDALITNADNQTLNISAAITAGNGFRITGGRANFVAGGGDFDGDGYDDVMLGNGANKSYLIYGGQTINGTFSILDIGDTGAGSAISGIEFSNSGTGLSSRITSGSLRGDLNGDGISDAIIGRGYADTNATGSGATHVIYGQGTRLVGDIDLNSVGAPGAIDGFEMRGTASNNRIGLQVSHVGDVNGDGFDDFITGSNNSNIGLSNGGSAYLIYGDDYTDTVDLVAGADPTTGTTAREVIQGSSGNDVLNGGGGADAIVAGGGDDVISIVGTDFAYIDGGLGNDTLLLSGGGTFNFDLIADNRMNGIEAIDAVNGVADTVIISIEDIFNASTASNTDVTDVLGFVENAFLIDLSSADGDTLELIDKAGAFWVLDAAQSALMPGYNIYEVRGGSGDVLASLAITDDITPILPTS